MAKKKKPAKKNATKITMASHPGNHYPSLPILFFVLVVGIVAALTLKYTNPSLLPFSNATQPTKQPQPANLFLILDSSVANRGTDIQAKIILDSPNQPVQAADFVVTFDPKFLSVKDVLLGQYFGRYPIKKISTGTLKLSGVALFKKNIPPPEGKGEVATIIFKTLSPTLRTTVAFDTVQTIIASNGKNIFGVGNGANITINPAE